MKNKMIWLLVLCQMNISFSQAVSDEKDTNYYQDWVGEWYEVIEGQTNELPSFVVREALYPNSFEEVWMGKGGDFGKAWRAYDTRTKKWDFAWMSTDGIFQLWEGRKENGIWYIYRYFILDNGDKVLSRQAFIVNDKNHMKRTSEHSRDEGKTWILRFTEIYFKK